MGKNLNENERAYLRIKSDPCKFSGYSFVRYVTKSFIYRGIFDNNDIDNNSLEVIVLAGNREKGYLLVKPVSGKFKERESGILAFSGDLNFIY